MKKLPYYYCFPELSFKFAQQVARIKNAKNVTDTGVVLSVTGADYSLYKSIEKA